MLHIWSEKAISTFRSRVKIRIEASIWREAAIKIIDSSTVLLLFERSALRWWVSRLFGFELASWATMMSTDVVATKCAHALPASPHVVTILFHAEVRVHHSLLVLHFLVNLSWVVAFLSFLHEFDDGDWGAYLAQDNDAKEHRKAVQLLIDQVEGKHAVDQSSREEDQTEQNRDWQDPDVKTFHLCSDRALEIYSVRDRGLELGAVLKDRYTKDQKRDACEGANPFVKGLVAAPSADVFAIYKIEIKESENW